ncbi:hypothetical protein NB311A_07438 [Nitrobacter sp. Nb-311A]|nr:hypothetical protein NB311A_07438 [Nitrobacter sp. Nb-311A]
MDEQSPRNNPLTRSYLDSAEADRFEPAKRRMRHCQPFRREFMMRISSGAFSNEANIGFA